MSLWVIPWYCLSLKCVKSCSSENVSVFFHLNIMPSRVKIVSRITAFNKNTVENRFLYIVKLFFWQQLVVCLYLTQFLNVVVEDQTETCSPPPEALGVPGGMQTLQLTLIIIGGKEYQQIWKKKKKKKWKQKRKEQRGRKNGTKWATQRGRKDLERCARVTKKKKKTGGRSNQTASKITVYQVLTH